MSDKLNVLWLREKLASPEQWSVRDRDDIGFFIEQKSRALETTPKHHDLFTSEGVELAGVDDARPLDEIGGRGDLIPPLRRGPRLA